MKNKKEKKRKIITELPEEKCESRGNSLRPQKFRDYIGQTRIKDMLSVAITAAKARKDPLDHILLYGPPGLGKTTLAGIIANEMGVSMKITAGPSIERPGEMAAILNGLKAGDILFIDEVHRLNKPVEELLYSAMEDYAIDILIGKDAQTRSIRLDLPKFTLIGATTRPGMLSAPLRDRFGIVGHMEYYNDAELAEIVKKSAERLSLNIEDPAADKIARRSRGTPRIANNFLKRIRDYAEVNHEDAITEARADEALSKMEVDKHGLNETDRRIIETIVSTFDGGPVGLSTLAAALGEDEGTIEDVYEPYLLKNGFINKTPRGRVATETAIRHLQRQKAV